ncbi:hypothetical protein KEM54_004696 [Ascosphaera aggregata]|nr:hypothetical protein KEM54_004696 [Ascosphaera aggregata]
MAPPADSSDEDDFRGDIPFKKDNGKKADQHDESGSDDESDEDGDDEEYGGNREHTQSKGHFADMLLRYVVEKILGHEWKDGELLFAVKWKGYDNPDDHTLEPEENLDNAKEIVNEYFSLIGGRPVKPQKKKRKSRASSAATEKNDTPEPTTTTTTTRKKARQSSSRSSTTAASGGASNVPDWVPRGNSWEQHVESIDTIMRDPDDPTGPLFVYLNWTNGNKSRVSTQQANQKCPQKMLQFYEQHM